MNLGAVRLREWRTRQGLVQARACARLGGIDQSLYSKYERGERKPPRTTAVAFERDTDGYVLVEHWDQPAEGIELVAEETAG